MRKITDYTWHTGKLKKPVRLLVVSDLHNSKYRDILPHLRDADVLLLPGDVVISYWQTYLRGIEFLREAAAVIPTYVGVGNHEIRLNDYQAYVQGVRDAGARFLFNTYERLGDLAIGCWYHPKRFRHTDILPAFQAEAGCRVLMCHRPEGLFQISWGCGCGSCAFGACPRRADTAVQPWAVRAGAGAVSKVYQGRCGPHDYLGGRQQHCVAAAVEQPPRDSAHSPGLNGSV